MRYFNQLIKDTYTHIDLDILNKEEYQNFRKEIQNIDESRLHINIDELEINKKVLTDLIKKEFLKLTKISPSTIEGFPITYDNKNSFTSEVNLTISKNEPKIKNIVLAYKHPILTFPLAFHEFTHIALIKNNDIKEANGEFFQSETLPILYELIGANIFSKLKSIDKTNIHDLSKNFQKTYELFRLGITYTNIKLSDKYQNEALKHSIFKNKKLKKQEQHYMSEKYSVSYGLASLLFNEYKKNPIKVLTETNKCLNGEQTLNDVLDKFDINYNNNKTHQEMKKKTKFLKK